MSIKQKHYYGWAGNDQGATMDISHESSINAAVKEARRVLGVGWTVHIMRVEIDGDGESYMGTTEVKTFKISEHFAEASALGKLGGSVKSDAKSAASAENGKKGGRPRKAKNDYSN